MRDGDEVNPSPVVASSGPDGFNVPVSLAFNNRCCKLRNTAAGDAIGNRDHRRRLRRQSKISTQLEMGPGRQEEADYRQTMRVYLSFIFSTLPKDC